MSKEIDAVSNTDFVTDEFKQLIEEGQQAVKDFNEERRYHKRQVPKREIMLPPKYMPQSPEAAARHTAAQATTANTDAIATLENRLMMLTLAHEELRKKVAKLEIHLSPVNW